MLEAQNISFAWKDALLLDNVTFSVASGEAVALVGANGAGKTTLMRILAGVIVPSAGTVLADGVDTFANPLRYLPENCPAEPDMRVRDYLAYRARLRGEMSKKIRHRVQEAISLCGLNECASGVIGRLSMGLRKRVALADALLLRPRFLLLDDLLAGLDAVTRASLGRILAAVSSFAAVVVSGHELDELEAHVGKFLVLKDGKMLGAKTAAGARALLLPTSQRKGEGAA